MSAYSSFVKSLLLVLLAAGSLQTALAEDDEGGSARGGALSGAPAPYQKECASCHMAYPAGLLPAGSWQHLMGNLGQHFGSDASLDTASVNVILSYLTSQGGTYKRVSEMPPQDRITQSNWFGRKHDKHVNASTWARVPIGSRANCVACHQGAEQGNFNEHSVRIPG
jgi:mono/diheme cytochrome c family protein